MANSFNLTAQINLQGPKNVKQVASQIKKQLGNISADVKITVDKNASKNVGQLNKNLIALKKNALAARGALAQLGSTAKSVTGQYKQLSSASSKLSDITKKNNSDFKNTKDQVGKAATAIEDFGKQSALAVKRFAAFTVVTSIVNQFTGAIANATSEFIEFDRQLVRIAQVTGGTKKQLKDLSNEITRLASAFGVSSSSLAEVSVTLSQAGLSATETRIALQALAKADLAPTFDNLKNTTEGAIAALRQFRLSANELEGALGSINAVAAKFAVESSDIITAIQRVGGVFASSSRGISEGQDALNEFIALFTSVRATTRESAETIATGLRTIFTRIQRGSTIAFLRELGVELQDLEGNFVGPFEAVKRLSEGLAGIDPRSGLFNKVIEELGGFRQVGKVIPLLQEFATAQKALGVAQQGSGSLTDAATKAQLALAIQISKVREEFLGLIRDIGESKTFQFLTGTALSFASALIKVVGAFKPILPLLAALTASKGFEFLSQFGKGFSGALKGVGGAAGIGANMGDMIGGGSKADSAQNMSANTAALVALTTEVKNLTAKIAGGSIGMNRGGSVPGTGNTDSVPAMLTPGEFVIRKSAVEAFGAGNLSKINKYAGGGPVAAGIDLNDVSDGDSLSVNFTPQGTPFKTSSRLSGYDAFETSSNVRGIKIPAWQQRLGKKGQALAASHYGSKDSQELTAMFNAINRLDAYGRPMYQDDELGQKLVNAGLGLPYDGKGPAPTKSLSPQAYKQRFGKAPREMAKGGSVSDTVPAMLTPGEFVINKASARAFGYGNLKKINGYNKGGAVGGVQYFDNGGNVKEANISMGDTLDASKAVSALNALATTTTETATKVRKSGSNIGETFEKTKRRVVAFGARLDDRFEAFGGLTTAAGAGLTLFAGKLSEMGDTFENLTGQAAETSTAFQAATQGLQGAGSGLQSGALAGQVLGGRRGRQIGGAVGAGLGATQGILQGLADAEKARAEKALLAAEQDLALAQENFDAAIGIKDRLETFRELKTATVDVSTAQKDAAAAADSFSQRGAAAAGTFIQIITALGAIAQLTGVGRRRGFGGRAKGKSKGGTIYASSGQLVDFEPKGTDTVPAMLTPGEFVVNADASRKHLDILEAINKSKGGRIGKPQYLQNGGRAGGEGIVGDVIDAVQGESESGIANIGTEIAASMATGAVPFAGAVKDFASAAANVYEGKWIDAFVDVGFGLYDAATDVFQAAGDVSVVGAAPATAAGMAEQVAQDQAQKAAKKGLRTLIPRLKKSIVEGFQSAKKTVGDVFNSVKKRLFGSGAEATAESATKGGAKKGADAAADAAKKTGLLAKTTTFLKKNMLSLGATVLSVGGGLFSFFGKSKEAALQQAEAASASANRIVEFSKALGSRLPDIQRQGTAEDREGTEQIDLGQLKTLMEADRATARDQFAKFDDASTSLLRASAIQLARESGDTRDESEIAKEALDDFRRSFLKDRGITGGEADKKIKEGFDPRMEKAFENYIASQNRAAAAAALSADSIDKLTKITLDLGYVAQQARAGIQRLSEDMKQIVDIADGRLGAIAGQADATAGMRNTDFEVLSNRQGFSSAEFKETIDRVSAAGGGGRTLDRAGALLELKKAQEETAKRLEGSPDASGAFRAEEFRKAFEGIGENLGKDFEAYKETLIQQAATTDDPEALEAFNKKVEEAQGLFKDIAKIKFDGLKQLNLQANKLSAAIQRVTQLQLQGAANFANDMNRISEAGGNRLSLADRQAPADAQIGVFQERTGTVGTGEGGAVTVGDFESRFNELDAQRQQLQQQQADQAQSGDTEGLAQTTKELGELNAASNTTRQALEFLANDTTRLDAAMNSLAERTKQLEAQQNSYMSALTDPEQLGKSLANFAAVAAGQGDRQQVGEALQFIESQRASLGEEEYQRRRRQVLEGGVASGAISETEAERLSVSDRREEDMDYQERKQLAIQEANIRQQANEALQRLEQQGVKTLEQSMIDLAQTINEKLIALIESAEGRSQDTREKERYVREGAPPVTDINTRQEIQNPFRDPLAPIPGVTDGAYGQDFTQTPMLLVIFHYPQGSHPFYYLQMQALNLSVHL